MSIADAFSGALKGGVTGFITGGIPGALGGAGLGALGGIAGGSKTIQSKLPKFGKVLPGAGGVIGGAAGGVVAATGGFMGRDVHGNLVRLTRRRRGRGFSARDIRQTRRMLALVRDVERSCPTRRRSAAPRRICR